MSIENDVDNLIDNLIDRIAECCDFSSEIDDSRSINDNDSNRDECGENVKINPEELDRKNPAYVPKRGGFYEHDPRFEKSDDA
uniref:Btz domain-containing protein n=1 Tax=Romanomermis culicivorax TaxID=13658 RepID=A0A915JMS1_ROMCU